MPRAARVKDNETINYVFVKGIDEAPLFREDLDKDEYINSFMKYRNIYGFKIYAYCMMKNYAHFIIDPCGADISSIMSSVNLAYSGKYNRKYNRHGHVFYGRFRSKIVKDEFELKALTLYIHNSPIELEEYREHPEKYKYSSLGAYIGLKDYLDVVDESFIGEFIGSNSKDRKKYLQLVPTYDAKKLIEDIEAHSNVSNSVYYKKSSQPKINSEEILNFISEYTGVSSIRIHSKYVKDSREVRALAAFILKNYYHVKTSEICSILGGISSSNASKLFLEGLRLVEENKDYSTLVDELNKKYIV